MKIFHVLLKYANFKRVIIILPLVLLFFLSAKLLPSSHPHLFIDYSAHFVFDDAGLTGIKVKWVFDEFFSITVRNDFDTNKNSQFEKKEISEIKSSIFKNIQQYDCYTYIYIDGEFFKFKKAKNFTAYYQGDKVVFEFLIPCEINALGKEVEIRFLMYDETIFVAFTLSSVDTVSFEGGQNIKREYTIYDKVTGKSYKGQERLQEIFVILSGAK